MPSIPKSDINIAQLSEGILSGERSALAKAITLAESTLDSDRILTDELLKNSFPVPAIQSALQLQECLEQARVHSLKYLESC